MTRLDEIPAAFDPPVDARPSAVVARIRAVRPSRRTVVRGLVISAAAAALVPLDWYLARREATAAPDPSTEGDDKAEHLSCTPESYREEANNWPATGPAVCYGGFRRGGFPCSDGYHREGSYSDGPDAFESTRVTQSCNGRNAWRWNGYRCSDAITNVVFADGTEYRGISIAACAAPGGTTTEPEPEPDRETTSPSPSNGGDDPGSGDSSSGDSSSGDSGSGDSSSGDSSSGDSGSGQSDSGDSSSGDSDGGGSDPSRPRRLLPSFGTNLRSIPVLGSMTGS